MVMGFVLKVVIGGAAIAALALIWGMIGSKDDEE